MPKAAPKGYSNQLAPSTPALGCAVGPSTGSHGVKVACATCNLRELCIPPGLNQDELEQIELVVNRRLKVKKGGLLFRSGKKFTALFTIRAGTFKSVVSTEDGREQITGFQMVGEVLGLDGIASGRHTCNSIALEDAEVCQMPFDAIVELSRKIPSLQFRLHQIMSREIVREGGIRLLAIVGAEKRLAAFLLDLVDRLHALGYSPTELVLRMTREEIGSYLGLKHETVSRAFSKLSEQGLVEVENRNIRFLRSDLLRELPQQGLPAPQHGRQPWCNECG